MRTGNLVHGLIGGAVFAFSLAVPTLAQAVGAPIPIALRPQVMPREPACDPNMLSIALDDMGGYFNGMSQSGTLLVLRNLGPDTCTVPGRPEVSFLDADGKALPAALRGMRGMFPGPVILPVALPGGAEVTSRMTWVANAGPYGDDGVCIRSAFLQLRVGAQTMRTPLQASVCGPKNEGPRFSETLFQRDPAYVPAQR